MSIFTIDVQQPQNTITIHIQRSNLFINFADTPRLYASVCSVVEAIVDDYYDGLPEEFSPVDEEMADGAINYYVDSRPSTWLMGIISEYGLNQAMDDLKEEQGMEAVYGIIENGMEEGLAYFVLCKQIYPLLNDINNLLYILNDVPLQNDTLYDIQYQYE